MSHRLYETRQYWDIEADTFDNEPDHGLNDPVVREAWKNLLKNWLPSSFNTVLDIGCGTGSLSVLIAGLGFEVTGIDLSPEMIAKAKTKAVRANQSITFHIIEASHPDFASQQFDVIVCRHLLWALPDPSQALLNWSNSLVSKGRILLIEGYWHNESGLHVQQVVNALPPLFSNIEFIDLNNDPDFWGGEVNDERYLIKADRI